MAEIKAAMVLAYIDWTLSRPQRIRDHCLDVAAMKAAMRKLKSKDNLDDRRNVG